MQPSSNGLDAILQKIRISKESKLILPPCPYCRRRLRTNVGYYTRKGRKLAAIALWCSACTVATTAFDVEPPPWAAPPPDSAGSATTGG